MIVPLPPILPQVLQDASRGTDHRAEYHVAAVQCWTQMTLSRDLNAEGARLPVDFLSKPAAKKIVTCHLLASLLTRMHQPTVTSRFDNITAAEPYAAGWAPAGFG